MDRRTMRCRILIILMLTIFLGCICDSTVAYAAERGSNEVAEADFDLELVQPQSATISLANGDTAEIGIRPVVTIRPMWEETHYNASGNWEIYYNSPIVYRHFYITISNHKITNAHSPSYTTFLCTVSGESFTWNSTEATYRLNVNALADMASTVAVLQAWMDGTTLHTYAN